jgi:hypothetical protein
VGSQVFVQRITSERITPQDYGAWGDGVHDDTVAFQAALDACLQVFIPAFAYLISDTLTVPVGSWIYGADRHGTKLNYTGTGNLFALPANGDWRTSITIENMTLNGLWDIGDPLDSTCGIACDEVTGDGTAFSVFRNLEISGFSYGIKGNCTTSKIEGFVIDSCYYGIKNGDASNHSNFVTIGGGEGINRVGYCLIGIQLEGGAGHIANCDIEYSTGTGTGIVCNYGATITHCHLEQLALGISILGQCYCFETSIGGCTVGIKVDDAVTLPVRFNYVTVALPTGAVTKNPIYAFYLPGSGGGKKRGIDIEVFSDVGVVLGVDDWTNIASGVNDWTYTTMN